MLLKVNMMSTVLDWYRKDYPVHKNGVITVK